MELLERQLIYGPWDLQQHEVCRQDGDWAERLASRVGVLQHLRHVHAHHSKKGELE